MKVFLTALLLAVAAAQEDDDRKRLDDVVRRLGSDDLQARDAASRDLLQTPLRLHPELVRRARSASDAEVRDRIGKALLPPEWLPFLSGTLKQARAQKAAILSANYREAVERALRALESLPLAEQRGALETLLAVNDPGARRLALEGMVRLPPKDLSTLVPLFSQESTQHVAGRIVMNAGDRSVCEALVPHLSALEREGEFFPSAAIRVLQELGLPGREKFLVDLARSGRATATDAPAILAATPGPEAEEALLGLYAAKDLDPRVRVAVGWALGKRGGPKAAAALLAEWETIPTEQLEYVVHDRRDPGLVRAWFRRIRREGRGSNPQQDLFARSDLELACLGGPALREDVLNWLKDTGLDGETRKKLLLLLGAVGGKEDGAFLRSLLRTPGLEEVAAEALGRIGDPADNRPLMDAFMVYTNGLNPGMALLSMPVEGLEADLEEIFTARREFPSQMFIALNMARRSPLPRVRAALFKGLLDDDKFWGDSRIAALLILAESREKTDGEAIDKLRASKIPNVKGSGLFLAQARGEEAALGELIPLLSGYSFLATDAAPLLETIPGTETARTAVQAAWKKRPDWKIGRNWLVRYGDAEATGHAKEEIRKAGTYFDIAAAVRSLVVAGDPEGMIRMLSVLDGLNRQFLGEEEVRLLAAHSDEKTRERLVLRAWGRPAENDDPCLLIVALAALPDAVPLYRSGVRGFKADSARNRFSAECARALARLHAREAVPDLRTMLRSPNGAHRAAAAEALGRLGDRESIPDLAVLLEDPAVTTQSWETPRPWIAAHRRVWHVAVEALEKLTGIKSEGRSTAEVRAFWREQVRKIK